MARSGASAATADIGATILSGGTEIVSSGGTDTSGTVNSGGVVRPLRPAFSRLSSFLWFATIVAGLTVRTELAGVTSIVRALNLRPQLYNKLLDNFHSRALKLDRLSALWARAVLGLFPLPLRVNGRLVLVGDGIKIGKRGRKLPPGRLPIESDVVAARQRNDNAKWAASRMPCMCARGPASRFGARLRLRLAG